MTRPAVPMLSEREVRVAGAASQRLCALRHLLSQGIVSGTLILKYEKGTSSSDLSEYDAIAVAAFLKEREETLLTGLNIALES